MKDFKYTINGKSYKVKVTRIDQDSADIEVNGKSFEVQIDKPSKNQPVQATTPAPVPKTATGEPVISKPKVKGGSSSITSPLPGVILDIVVNVGDEVKKGQKVLVLEAMKMENNINADRDGKIIEIKVTKGESIMEGADLIIIG